MRGAQAGNQLAKADSGTKRPLDLRCAKLRYRPKPLAIPRVVLVRAQRREGNDEDIFYYPEICADDALGWRTVAGNVKLVNIDRGHSTMLQKRFVDSHDGALLRYLSGRPDPLFKPLSKATVHTTENVVRIGHLNGRNSPRKHSFTSAIFAGLIARPHRNVRYPISTIC
jgi:hypothetical protein